MAHHIDLEFLQEAFRRTRKDGATGVDGQTSGEYEERLEENLRSLLDRFKSGQYKAPPVRRTYVPKGDGKQQRPIGIPTFEDKVLQRAVTMVLGAVYDRSFSTCSYGYRPGRSAHQALTDLRQELMVMGGGWVLEVDIKSFFDTISHSRLREILDQRVRDGVLRRTIDKWLAAGVMEGTVLSHPDAGTPQGGVVSPLLANIYLHEVLDRWFERDVKPRLGGRAFMVRFADDLVMAFGNERDARRVWTVLPKRLGRYGLTLHPTKNKAGGVPTTFGRRRNRRSTAETEASTYWGSPTSGAQSRRGFWVVKLKTAGDRFGRSGQRNGCRSGVAGTDMRPSPGSTSSSCGSYAGTTAITVFWGNYAALVRFRYELGRVWQKWLNRRSNQSRMPWERFNRLLKRYPLLEPRIRCPLQPRAANP